MKSIASLFMGIVAGCVMGMLILRRNETTDGNKEHTFGINELAKPGSQTLEEIRKKITEAK